MTSALMIVDVQQGMFAVSPPPHRGEEIVWRIAGLLARARAEGWPVVHVQHAVRALGRRGAVALGLSSGPGG